MDLARYMQNTLVEEEMSVGPGLIECFEQQVESQEIIGIVNQKPLKLLIVEDNDLVCSSLSRCAKKMGFEVIVTNDGLHSIKLAESEKPDIIILDINLPGLDGRDVFLVFKERGLTRNAAVVFVSGRYEQCDRRVGLELGADDYITKPFEATRLFRKLRRIWEKKVNISYKERLRA